jgi:GNAT superfamily N-acetyltransferase
LMSVRDDIPEASAAAWRGIGSRLPVWDGARTASAVFEELRAAVSTTGRIERESIGPAFGFGEQPGTVAGVDVRRINATNVQLLDRFFPYTRTVLEARLPVVGVIVDGAVVSACFSARRNDIAAEAGVATEDAYRGRGFGAAVVSAWREVVEASGLVPLYSTWWENEASLGIARTLGLVAYAETLSIS